MTATAGIHVYSSNPEDHYLVGRWTPTDSWQRGAVLGWLTGLGFKTGIDSKLNEEMLVITAPSGEVTLVPADFTILVAGQQAFSVDPAEIDFVTDHLVYVRAVADPDQAVLSFG